MSHVSFLFSSSLLFPSLGARLVRLAHVGDEAVAYACCKRAGNRSGLLSLCVMFIKLTAYRFISSALSLFPSPSLSLLLSSFPLSLLLLPFSFSFSSLRRHWKIAVVPSDVLMYSSACRAVSQQ